MPADPTAAVRRIILRTATAATTIAVLAIMAQRLEDDLDRKKLASMSEAATRLSDVTRTGGLRQR